MSSLAARPALTRTLPFLKWWPLVDRKTLRADAIAGFVGALVVLPQGVAFATLAGLPPEYGLYASMVPVIVAALFGSSLHGMSGPTNPVSLMVLASLAGLAVPGTPYYIHLALTLAFMAGVIMIAVGLLRLGSLLQFVSDTVVVGFTAAVALLVFASQLPDFLGISIPPAASFTALVLSTFIRLSQVQPWVAVVACATLAVGAAARAFCPRVPPMLVAMLAGGALAWALNAWLGPARTGLRTLGALPGALSPLSAPDVSPITLGTLLGPSLAVAAVCLIQAYSVTRALALKSGQRVDYNQEFVGQGLANVSASFFSGMAVSMSVNRCVLNYESGARTPMAAIVSALVLVFVLAAIGGLAAYLPYAVVAGMLFIVAWSLIDFARIRQIVRTSRGETTVLAVTFVATLLLDMELAIALGVLASLVVYLHRTSHPIMRTLVPDPRHPNRKMTEPEDDLRECPQAKILRIEGSIWFGAVSHVERHFDTLREHARSQEHLVLMAKSVNFVDMAGAELLAEEAERRRATGGRLYFYSLRQPVEDLLRRGGYMKRIGEENVFRGKREAFATVFERVDRKVCATCRARIFEECAALPPPAELEKPP
jgi:sulfate permease, SulP family